MKKTALIICDTGDVSTPAMILGELVHCMVLEPEKVPERYFIAPNVNGATKEGKACAWEIECPFNFHDLQIDELEGFKKAMVDIYAPFCKGLILAYYSFEADVD